MLQQRELVDNAAMKRLKWTSETSLVTPADAGSPTIGTAAAPIGHSIVEMGRTGALRSRWQA
jgi:hypothetical protein